MWLYYDNVPWYLKWYYKGGLIEVHSNHDLYYANDETKIKEFVKWLKCNKIKCNISEAAYYSDKQLCPRITIFVRNNEDTMAIKLTWD